MKKKGTDRTKGIKGDWKLEKGRGERDGGGGVKALDDKGREKEE